MAFNKAKPEKYFVNHQHSVGSHTMPWPVLFRKQVRGVVLVLATLVSFLCLSSIHATAQSNSTSPLGTNLFDIEYYSPEQPFLNIFKTGNSWSIGSGTFSAFYASLDANGYPPSVTGYSPVYTVVLRNLNGMSSYTYPAGTYVWLYDGTGTFSFSGDASVISSAPGRILLNVANPTGAGITITLTSTGSNYAKNFRLVYSPDSTSTVIGTREALLNSGEIFNPDFIDRIKSYKTLRFINWLGTLWSYQTNWSDRPTQNWVFWNDDLKFNGGFGNGTIAPIEVMVALCNKINADCWFNMPLLSTDDYVAQFATLVHSSLNANLKVYVEYGNEMWLQGYPTALRDAVAKLGWAAFPALNGDTWNGIFAYGLLRAVQNGATWKSVWGADAGRVVRVVAGQNSFQARNLFILGFTAGMAGGDSAKFNGTVAANVDAFATAPYFGYDVPNTFTLDQLFTEMMSGGLVSGGYPGGMVKQALDWVAENYAGAASYGLPLIAYEGGQTFVDYSHSDTALQTLYAAANRDPRMGTAYTKLLNGWKSAGGTLFNHYMIISAYSKWGYWGALENVLQSSSPKYSALLNFISANPCWWNGCSTTANTPTPTPSADTTPPSVPGGVAATTISTTQVNLSWTASIDNVGVAGYKVFRNGAQVGTTSNTSYQDTGLSAGTAYTYAVSAYDAAGNTSAQSSSVSITTLAPTSAPAPSVAINSPSNGSVVNGSANIAVSANSANGIASITITADGNPLATCSSVTSCSTTWQKKKITQGTHSIGAIATDGLGLPVRASVTIVTRQ